MKLAKLRAVQKEVPGVAVVVIKLGGFLLLFLSLASKAAVLPEDRSDALYHAYDGGGLSVNGPSILVRKGFKEKVSVYANFYQDYISSASIDVLVSGSKYTEQRTEQSAGIDFLNERSMMSLGFSTSIENDFESETVNFGISQDFFGDMTTLALSYARGEDVIMRNGTVADGEEAFRKEAGRQRFSVGLTQVLTKNWIMAFNAESAVDKGFLNNPYRQVRSHRVDSRQQPTGEIIWTAEIYPLTRNSDAVAMRSMYYLPYRASVRFEARAFADSWGIQSENYELRYIHPVKSTGMILELKARHYAQTQADFYSDLFAYENEFDFMARDKELSTYSTFNFGLGVSYDFKDKILFAEKQSVSFNWDFLQFQYENYLDACKSRATEACLGRSPAMGEQPEFAFGDEPAYAFEANVLRMMFSIYY